MAFKTLFLRTMLASALFGRKHKEEMAQMEIEQEKWILEQQKQLEIERQEREDALTEQAKADLDAFKNEMIKDLDLFLQKNKEIKERTLEISERIAVAEANNMALDVAQMIETGRIEAEYLEKIANAQQAMRERFITEMSAMKSKYNTLYYEMTVEAQEEMLRQYTETNDMLREINEKGMTALYKQQLEFQRRTKELFKQMETARKHYQEYGDAYIQEIYEKNIAKFEQGLLQLVERNDALREMWIAEMDHQREEAAAYAQLLEEREAAQAAQNEKRREDQLSLIEAEMQYQNGLDEDYNEISANAMNNMMDYQKDRLEAEQELKMREMELEKEIQQQELQSQQNQNNMELATYQLQQTQQQESLVKTATAVTQLTSGSTRSYSAASWSASIVVLCLIAFG